MKELILRTYDNLVVGIKMTLEMIREYLQKFLDKIRKSNKED